MYNKEKEMLESLHRDESVDVFSDRLEHDLMKVVDKKRKGRDMRANLVIFFTWVLLGFVLAGIISIAALNGSGSSNLFYEQATFDISAPVIGTVVVSSGLTTITQSGIIFSAFVGAAFVAAAALDGTYFYVKSREEDAEEEEEKEDFVELAHMVGKKLHRIDKKLVGEIVRISDRVDKIESKAGIKPL